MKRLSIPLALALLVAPGAALADEPPRSEPLPPLEESPAPARTARSSIDPLRISAGLKVGYVHTRGFDTYADSNTLPQLSIDATYMFWSRGRLGLAAGLGWDVGGRGDDLRGLDASLTMHRFLVPIEARVSLTPWLWGFGKLAPGAAMLLSEVQDPSAPRSLSATGWAFATDVSAGATFVLGRRPKDKRGIRFLVTPEIGYSITTAAPLRPNPGRDEDELLGADADTGLRSVAMSGLFWRATVGVSF